MSCGSSGRTERGANASARLTRFRPLSLAFALTLAFSAAAPAAEEAQTREIPEGAEVIRAEGISALMPLQGKAVALAIGMRPGLGDRIRTSKESEVVLRYPDGSEVALGKSSEVGFLKNSDGVQRMLIRQGSVRGLIQKKLQAAQKNPTHYFRTKSAVMGVRGTDFVFSFDPATSKAEVHTLQGLVEVAKDESLIEQAKGTRVAENQTLAVDLSGFKPVQTFDRNAYLATLTKANPFLSRAEKFAEASSPPIDPNGLSLRQFQLGPIVLPETFSPKETSNLFGLETAWRPSYRIGRMLALRLNLGFFFARMKTSIPSGPPCGPYCYVPPKERINVFLTTGASLDFTPFWGLTLSLGIIPSHFINSDQGKITLILNSIQLAWRFGPNSWLERIYFGGTGGEYAQNPLLPPPWEGKTETGYLAAGIGFRI